MESIKVTINNTDISTLGMTFQDGAISAMLTPPPAKEYITNNIPLSNGKQYVGGGYFNERELSLPFNLTAKSTAEFLSRYATLMGIIDDFSINVKVELETVVEEKGANNVVTNITKVVKIERSYKYVSCTQFSHYNLDMAMFVLKVVEPSPSNDITITTKETQATQ